MLHYDISYMIRQISYIISDESKPTASVAVRHRKITVAGKRVGGTRTSQAALAKGSRRLYERSMCTRMAASASSGLRRTRASTSLACSA